LAKKLAFFAQAIASFCKKFIITLIFDENANFFAENRQKSPKIVIITSTPGFAVSGIRRFREELHISCGFGLL
jgi:hypothetical protein